MYNRLIKIDELTRPDHTYLKPEDECYYLGEYTARGGFGASPTNDLIINLKKPMDRRDRAEWEYKNRAIKTIGKDLQRILEGEGIESATFVPIPPSKIKDDPMYDSRLMQVLAVMSKEHDADVRELVLQRESVAPAHESDVRPSIPDLVGNYVIDEKVAAAPLRKNLVIFDDVLTTGCHFKALQTTLLERFPKVGIFGLFVARRAPKTDEPAIL